MITEKILKGKLCIDDGNMTDDGIIVGGKSLSDLINSIAIDYYGKEIELKITIKVKS